MDQNHILSFVAKWNDNLATKHKVESEAIVDDLPVFHFAAKRPLSRPLSGRYRRRRTGKTDP